MMGAGGITNVGPINTQTTGKGAIMGFDPIMKLHRRAVKKRKKMESAGKQWDHRRQDPTYIDGRSKAARKLIKRLTKKKKMAEELIKEDDKSASGGETTKQAYKFINQKRKVQKKQEREKRAANRKQEIQQLSKAKAKDYQKKAGDRQKKISKDINKSDKKESFDWQSTFTAVNHRFAELRQEEQEDMLCTWLQLSEDNQKQFLYVLMEDHGVDTLQKFIKET